MTNLRHFNSFGVDSFCQNFSFIEHSQQLLDHSVINGDEPSLILGGGSNILFADQVNESVVHLRLKGISLDEQPKEQVKVTAQASENWHQLVNTTVAAGLGGIENLALIPGTVGAAPVQNIGAYGVELSDVFHSLDTYDRLTGQFVTFTKDDCRFGYRDSIFKQKLGRYVICSVSLLLSKRFKPKLDYSPLSRLVDRSSELTPVDVMQQVIAIRQAKLPDPQQLGNAGSFFKNPVITADQYKQLSASYPNVVGYPQSDARVKIAAGWLIDNLGLKGFRVGDAAVHQHQALVLVNHGHATGQEIYDLSKQVMSTVKQHYGIELEREVRLVGEFVD